MLSKRVKLNYVTNLSDARYAAGMGVEFLGFPFNKETLEEDIKRFTEISGWVAGVEFVAETNVKDIRLAELGIHYIESDEPSVIDYYKSIKTNLLTILRCHANAVNIHEHMAGKADFLHILTTGDTLNAELLNNLIDQGKECIMSVDGLPSEAIEQLSKKEKPEILSISGSEEISPGLKDYDAIATCLEILETE